MKNSQNLAIAILNWNGVVLLQKFLPSVVNHSEKAKIYIIDNASNDGSVFWLQMNYPEVELLILDKNYGYAGAYNQAVEKIAEPIICFLNSDVEVTPNWLTPIANLFASKKHVVAIQPKIKDFKRKTHFEYAGAAGGFIDAFGYPYCRGRIFDKIEEDLGQYDTSYPIFWASGACLFVRKETFLNVGGFDTDFFAHQEEIDLCWRLKNEGNEIYYCGESTVYHVGGATLQTANPKKTYLNFRNNLCMLVKNLPLSYLFLIIPIRLILDGIAGFAFLFKRKPLHTWAIVKAHFSFYSRIHKMFKSRQSKQLRNYYESFSVLKIFF